MIWDDVRFFLAVARHGSVRAASEHLDVNHSTVLRRVGQLERQLGAHLFERLPTGYRLTDAGEEALVSAETMEASSYELQARLLGRDQGVRGSLRVTLPPVVATHLLMADIVAYSRAYPDVEVEVLSLDEPVNLTNREADVAVRNVYDRASLPPNLHGMRGPEVFWSVYISRDLLAAWRTGDIGGVRWISKNRYGHPEWCWESDVLAAGVPFKVTDAAAQVLAARQGVGMTLLPRFVGDADPLLARVPGCPVRM